MLFQPRNLGNLPKIYEKGKSVFRFIKYFGPLCSIRAAWGPYGIAPEIILAIGNTDQSIMNLGR